MTQRRRLVAALLATSFFVLPAISARAAACGSVSPAGDWQRIAAPTFQNFGWSPVAGPAPQKITYYEPDMFSKDRLWVTNGATAMRSEDGGCTWQLTFSVEPASHVEAGSVVVDGPAETIDAIVTLPANRGFILASSLIAVPPGPTVWLTEDGGHNWASYGPGLPPAITVEPEGITASPAGPFTVYVLARSTITGKPELYRSDDSGKSDWYLVAGTEDLAVPSGGRLSGVLADPRDPGTLYVWGTGAPLYKSTDGGASFETDLDAPPPTGGFTVAMTPSAVEAAVLYSTGADLYAIEGTTTRRYAARVAAASVAVGTSLNQAFVATGADGRTSRVLRYSPRIRRFVAVSGAPALRDVRSDGAADPVYSTTGPTFYACDDNAIYRYVGPMT